MAPPAQPVPKPADNSNPPSAKSEVTDPPTDPIQINPAPSKPKPEPVYRPSDSRRILKAEEINQYSLNMVESKHLRLYSDLPLEEIALLPPIIDQAYEAWVDYFGKLPENREGTDFQITGYVMADVEHFRNAGLIPEQFSELGNGRHRGAEFWMPAPKQGYYRQHLLIHEATHSYMMYLPRTSAPVWYLEGMAELFATHLQDTTGKYQFRIFPDKTENFPGLGRIELVQRDIEKSGLKNLVALGQLEATGFQSVNSYAWAWAICAFLDQHPHYKERFQEMGRDYLLEEPLAPLIKQVLENELRQLNQEWLSYVSELEYGLDLTQLVIDFKPDFTAVTEQSVPVEIQSSRSWQSTGWLLEKGEKYHLQTEGEFSLAEEPKPWVSTANGISFQYHRGFPLGRLLGAIVPSTESTVDKPYSPHDHCFARPASFGEEIIFEAPYSGTLFLRLNDYPTQMSDNEGAVSVSLKQVQAEP